MTIPILKVKVARKPVLKGKMDVRFPVNIKTEKFLTVDRANGAYTFDVDYTLLSPGTVTDPTKVFLAVLNQVDGLYEIVSLAVLIAQTTQIDQHITAAGPVDVLPNAGIVRVDQASGAAITLNMPLASAKTCPVLVSDWKGDAGTNNITIALAGSDTFPGGLTTWTIAGNTGSVFLRPIPNVGYVL